jgi:hypothetical protein
MLKEIISLEIQEKKILSGKIINDNLRVLKWR